MAIHSRPIGRTSAASGTVASPAAPAAARLRLGLLLPGSLSSAWVDLGVGSSSKGVDRALPLADERPLAPTAGPPSFGSP